MSYSKDQTLGCLDKTLKNSIETLYKKNFVNRIGRTNDTKEFYTEVISEKLLQLIENNKIFDNINTVQRTNTYHVDSHSIVKMDIGKSNRNEEIFAKRLIGLELPDIGLIKDYQIPLKSSRKDLGLGKIDLLSFNLKNGKIFLIELKYNENKETLLRAVLESYTYFKVIDHDKLKLDFKNDYGFIKNHFKKEIKNTKITVSPAVLLTKDCQAFKELQDIENRPNLKKLIKGLGVKIFTINIECKQHAL